jgi:hypothetical protein
VKHSVSGAALRRSLVWAVFFLFVMGSATLTVNASTRLLGPPTMLMNNEVHDSSAADECAQIIDDASRNACQHDVAAVQACTGEQVRINQPQICAYMLTSVALTQTPYQDADHLRPYPLYCQGLAAPDPRCTSGN